MGQAQKKSSIRVPLNIVDIDQIGIDKSSYCYLMNNDIKQGPYLTSEVEELIIKNPHLTAHFIIVDMEEQTETSAIGNIRSITNDVFLLVNGQKNGPFTMQELESKLHSKEILYTDYISLDSGHEWIKISDHDSFNRRSSNRDEHLPTMPQEQLFNSSNAFKANDNQENDALIGLAYIGKNGDKKPQKIFHSTEKSMAQKKLNSVNWGKMFKFFFLVASFLGMIFIAKFYYENRSEPTKKEKTENKKANGATKKNIQEKTIKAKKVKPNVSRKYSGSKNKRAKSYKKPTTSRSFKKSAPYQANRKIQARRRIEESKKRREEEAEERRREEEYQNEDKFVNPEPVDELDPIDEGLEDDIINPKGDDIEDLVVDEEFINEINDAVEDELFDEELDF